MNPSVLNCMTQTLVLMPEVGDEVRINRGMGYAHLRGKVEAVHYETAEITVRGKRYPVSSAKTVSEIEDEKQQALQAIRDEEQRIERETADAEFKRRHPVRHFMLNDGDKVADGLRPTMHTMYSKLQPEFAEEYFDWYHRVTGERISAATPGIHINPPGLNKYANEHQIRFDPANPPEFPADAQVRMEDGVLNCNEAVMALIEFHTFRYSARLYPLNP
jgi:hypothetical protein